MELDGIESRYGYDGWISGACLCRSTRIGGKEGYRLKGTRANHKILSPSPSSILREFRDQGLTIRCKIS